MSRQSAFTTAICVVVLTLATASAAVTTVARAGAGVEKAAAQFPAAAASRVCAVTAVPANDPVTGDAATALVMTCS